jgi:hypothetical protein
MNHQLGRNVDEFVWVIGGLAVVEGCLFALAHGSPQTLITIEIVVGIAGLLIYEARYRNTEAGISRSIRALLQRVGRPDHPSVT